VPNPKTFLSPDRRWFGDRAHHSVVDLDDIERDVVVRPGLGDDFHARRPDAREPRAAGEQHQRQPAADDTIRSRSDQWDLVLAKLGEALSGALKMPISALWKMQNGYALCTRAGLDAITGYLSTLVSAETDILGGKVVHRRAP
jgi:hypothetical protein